MRRVAYLILLLAACPAASRADDAAPCAVADRIRQTLEAALPELHASVRKHYAVRVFRATGDRRYLDTIIADYESTRRQLQADLDSVGNAAYLQRRGAHLRSALEGEGRKDRLRRKLFAGRDDALLDLSILYDANLLIEYGLPDSFDGALVERARAHLSQADLAGFLLDPSVIEVYSAQAANCIAYLETLGLEDLRARFRSGFERVFPDREDWQLDDSEFGDKVYGLTHIVIASSGYYQTSLDPAAFDWILEYFGKNLKRILSATKPDIIAEVGVCFLLCARESDPVVAACRERILHEFDREAGLIPSPSGSIEPNASEHRNLLAMLLLCWPPQLHPGPLLATYPEFRNRPQR